MSESGRKTLLFAALVGAFLVLLLGLFGSGSSSVGEKTTYSALIARAEHSPDSILQVRFRPGSKTVEATLVGGRVVTSSSTRSTPSAAIVAPAWVAATTSASRR